jgi:hypothetical protein
MSGRIDALNEVTYRVKSDNLRESSWGWLVLERDNQPPSLALVGGVRENKWCPGALHAY